MEEKHLLVFGYTLMIIILTINIYSILEAPIPICILVMFISLYTMVIWNLNMLTMMVGNTQGAIKYELMKVKF